MHDPGVRLLYFLLLIPLSWLSTRWLWEMACRFAGVSRQDVWKYRASLQHRPHAGWFLWGWLTSRPLHSRKTKLFLRLYLVGMAPSLIAAMLAVNGLFLRILDEILFYAGIFVPCVIAVSALAYVIYRRKYPDAFTEKNSLVAAQREFFSFLKNWIYKKEIEPYPNRYRGSRIKLVAQGVFSLLVVISVMVGLFLIILNASNPTKKPVTSQQMWDVLASQGYQPQDITQEVWESGSNLNRALRARDEDGFYFLFNDFNEEGGGNAQSVYRQVCELSRKGRDLSAYQQSEQAQGNYAFYTLQGNGTYLVCARVKNTVIYGSIPEEHAEALQEIMISIGYFDRKENSSGRLI